VVELAYKEHRVVDDAHGVITAMELTRSQVHDGSRLAPLTYEHEQNTQIKATRVTLSGDQHYGTIENYRFCRQTGLRAHMAPARAHFKERGLFAIEQFTYEQSLDRYCCPAGHYLTRLQVRPREQHVVYQITEPWLCAQCPLRTQCTKAKAGRTVIRYDDQVLLDKERQRALGAAGCYSRKRRKHVVEGRFADAVNHGSKRARWRRLWRQQIQSWMICAVQNLKVLLAKRANKPPKAAATAVQTVELSDFANRQAKNQQFYRSIATAAHSHGTWIRRLWSGTRWLAEAGLRSALEKLSRLGNTP
jgi:hypothetical protein